MNPKTVQVYGWLDWVVTKGLPFTFCEDETNCQYSRLKPLSYKTFMKYLGKVSDLVKQRIAQNLPEVFGLCFDGWSDDSVHYIGLFAYYVSERGDHQYPLLAFSPLLEEQDLSASS